LHRKPLTQRPMASSKKSVASPTSSFSIYKPIPYAQRSKPIVSPPAPVVVSAKAKISSGSATPPQANTSGTAKSKASGGGGGGGGSSGGVAKATPAATPVKSAAEVEEEARQRAAEEEAAAEDAARAAAAALRTTAEVEEQARQAALEEARRAAEELAQRELNGVCTIRYNHYVKEVAVAEGGVTSFAVDAVLFLSFVFKFCCVHLVETDSKASSPAGKEGKEHWVPERPGEENEQATIRSTILSVKAGHIYWAIVEEDDKERAVQEQKAAASMAEFLKKQAEEAALTEEEREARKAKPRGEGCSCIYGNPCENQYTVRLRVPTARARTARINTHCSTALCCTSHAHPHLPTPLPFSVQQCQDWARRFEVAKANGWTPG
jgi:hypothetical protein